MNLFIFLNTEYLKISLYNTTLPSFFLASRCTSVKVLPLWEKGYRKQHNPEHLHAAYSWELPCLQPLHLHLLKCKNRGSARQHLPKPDQFSSLIKWNNWNTTVRLENPTDGCDHHFTEDIVVVSSNTDKITKWQSNNHQDGSAVQLSSSLLSLSQVLQQQWQQAARCSQLTPGNGPSLQLERKKLNVTPQSGEHLKLSNRCAKWLIPSRRS